MLFRESTTAWYRSEERGAQRHQVDWIHSKMLNVCTYDLSLKCGLIDRVMHANFVYRCCAWRAVHLRWERSTGTMNAIERRNDERTEVQRVQDSKG